ncbi:MAG: LytTR family DNA-binding domain-containing protein [Acidobacteriota bacterium]
MREADVKRPLRVMIVDDEALAREHIADRLAAEENVEVVGTAEDGDEAVEAIRRLQPDLVFLDVQMPGLTGVEVVETIGAANMPATIFTTAFDQYALKAFEVAAVDYLVKPFDDDRFSEAFRRARRSVELQDVERMTRRLFSLLDPQPLASEAPQKSPWLQRIPVEMRGQMRVVPVEKIDYITASGPYAELHVGQRTFAVRERMQDLEERLDPAAFMRVHRSVIVHLDRIDVLLRSSGGDYAVRLKDGTELSVSRTKRDALEARLGAS